MENVITSYDFQCASLLSNITSVPSTYLIAVSGIPGAGKTTFCNEFLKYKLPNSTVLQMDGYHLYRSQLDEKSLKFRGAPYTFDSKRFKEDLIKLKKERKGLFPSFDHALKDPKEDDIIISEEHRYVIVEGLYLLLREWELNDLWDVKVFLECDLDVAMERVAQRHLKCGIVSILEEGFERANFNDRPNGEYILENSVLDEKVFRVKTS